MYKLILIVLLFTLSIGCNKTKNQSAAEEIDLASFINLCELYRETSPQMFWAFRQSSIGKRIRTKAFVVQQPIICNDDELDFNISSSMANKELIFVIAEGYPDEFPNRSDGLRRGLYKGDEILIEATIHNINSCGAIFVDCKVIEIYTTIEE